MDFIDPDKPITHRRVWMLAGPIILSNISVPLVGAVDTAVVGHLGEAEPIGAVALGALIFSFLYWGFGFLRMGTTGFVAKYFGAGNQSALFETIIRVSTLAIALGLFCILIGHPLTLLALHLIESSEAVETLTADYATIRIWSAPAVLTIYAFTGIFIGLQNTRAAFILQLVLNITNMLLDALFVLGFGWGVEGVALASVIAEYLAMATGVFLLWPLLRPAWKQMTLAILIDSVALRELFAANGNIFIRTLCLLFAFSYFTAIGAGMGEVVLAANAILLHLQSIMAYALDGFAHAVEALAGGAYGAKNKFRLVQAIKISTLWSGFVAVGFGLIYWIAGPAIIGMFTNVDDVLYAANMYLPWMIIAPVLSVWSFQLDGIFIGVGHTREMRNAMVFSLVCYLLIIYWSVDIWGNHGLFFALSCFMLIRAFSLIVYLPGIFRKVNREQEATV